MSNSPTDRVQADPTPQPEPAATESERPTGKEPPATAPDLDEVLSGGKDAVSLLSEQFWEELRKPTTGAALVGAAVVGSMVVIGAAETAVGAATAYVVYRILKKKRREEPPQRSRSAAG